MGVAEGQLLSWGGHLSPWFLAGRRRRMARLLRDVGLLHSPSERWARRALPSPARSDDQTSDNNGLLCTRVCCRSRNEMNEYAFHDVAMLYSGQRRICIRILAQSLLSLYLSPG